MAARWFLVGMAIAAVACAGPNVPDPPDDPVVGPATPPVIRAITVPTSRVETGLDVTITADVTDAETPLTKLIYNWAVNVGSITGDGATATWRHSAGLKTGADVVVTLTVVDTYDTVVNHVVVRQDYRVVSQAAPFRVHDSVAEMKELARKFLVDLFGNSSIPAEQCLVDFSDTCATVINGKDDERSDIISHREQVVVQQATILTQDVSLTSPSHAIVVNDSVFIDRWLADGQVTQYRGDFVVTGVYELGRWWICQSYVDRSDSTNSARAAALYRTKRGGGPPRK